MNKGQQMFDFFMGVRYLLQGVWYIAVASYSNEPYLTSNSAQGYTEVASYSNEPYLTSNSA